MSGGEEAVGSQFTPTWIVALVCTFIVAVSFAFDCALHYIGKFLKKKNKKLLFQALQKIKEGDDYPSTKETLGYCAAKGNVPLLSVEALHHLHIFIFVLAVIHVTSCVLTIVFGGLKIRGYKHWEDSIIDENHETQHALDQTVTYVHQHDFNKNHFTGFDKDSAIVG